MPTRLGGTLALALLAVLALLTAGEAQDRFFEGKTIRIIVGFSAGGGFDTYSRAIARHLGKHVPGHPSVIVENMTGAASIIAANHVYKVAKPDGLTIANFHGNQILGQLLGRAGIEFDARKFQWLGVPSKDNTACVMTRASGIRSLEQWQAAKTPVKLGAVGPGDTTHDTGRMLDTVLRLPIQLVRGYKGTADIRLAAEAGEVGGACWQWESIKVTWRKALEAGDITPVLQITPRPLPDLPNVPLASSIARTDEARRLLEAGIQVPTALSRLYAVPPATPKDRVQALRAAFLATLKDPEFVAETKKARLEIDPVSGEELEQTVQKLLALDPALVAKLKEILR